MQPYSRWHVDVNVSDCLDYVDGDIDGDGDDGDETILKLAWWKRTILDGRDETNKK